MRAQPSVKSWGRTFPVLVLVSLTLVLTGWVATPTPVAAVGDGGVDLEPGCRVRHLVHDPSAFVAAVAAQRSHHLAVDFKVDDLYDELAPGDFVVPIDHREFWGQPVAFGPISPLGEWGWRLHPVHRAQRFHNGLDVQAARHTPVASLASGTVVIAAYRGGFLNRLYVLLFGRAPDLLGQDYWLDRMAMLGRWQVLVSFTESPEGRLLLD